MEVSELKKLFQSPVVRQNFLKMISSEGEDLFSHDNKLVCQQSLSERFENQSVFLALLQRQVGLQRWSKSQLIQPESLNDHCVSVSYIGLLIGQHYKLSNPASDFSPERLTVFCLFHDSAETLSEDINGVLKASDPTLRGMIKDVESLISQKMSSTIDPLLRPSVAPYFLMECSEVEKDFVKAADLLSAYAKAKCELRSNNGDFAYAASQLKVDIKPYLDKYPSVKFVYEHYMNAFDLTIDEIITFLPKIGCEGVE